MSRRAISEPKRESRWKERGKKVLRGALDDRRKRGEGKNGEEGIEAADFHFHSIADKLIGDTF